MGKPILLAFGASLANRPRGQEPQSCVRAEGHWRVGFARQLAGFPPRGDLGGDPGGVWGRIAQLIRAQLIRERAASDPETDSGHPPRSTGRSCQQRPASVIERQVIPAVEEAIDVFVVHRHADHVPTRRAIEVRGLQQPLLAVNNFVQAAQVLRPAGRSGRLESPSSSGLAIPLRHPG